MKLFNFFSKFVILFSFIKQNLDVSELRGADMKAILNDFATTLKTYAGTNADGRVVISKEHIQAVGRIVGNTAQLAHSDSDDSALMQLDEMLENAVQGKKLLDSEKNQLVQAK